MGEESEGEAEVEVKVGCLASYSIFFGVGMFGFLRLPEPWELRILPEPPECDLLGDWNPSGDFRWVLKGRVKAFLLNEGQNRAYVIQVETRDARDVAKAEEHIEKKVGKLKGSKRSQVLEEGTLEVSGHRARYLVLAVHKKRLLGRPKLIYKLVMPFYCDETKRILWIEVLGGQYLLEDLPSLIPIISSFSCHGEPPDVQGP